MRPVPVLAVVALLLVAGCAAPLTGGDADTTTRRPDTTTAPATAPAPTTTATDPPTATTAASTTPGSTTATTPAPRQQGAITVRGLALPGDIDAGVVYERVASMTNVSATEGPVVVVKRTPDRAVSEGTFETDSPFLSVVGLTPPANDSGVGLAGLAIGTTVFLYVENATPTDVEETLAHEYYHVIQGRIDARQRFVEAERVQGNFAQIRAVVVEGTATYVDGAYARRYLGANDTRNETAWARTPAFVKYSAGPYYYGERYLESRFDSPANVSRVYDDPPRTTEQVLHGLAPDAEPMRNLTASAAPDDQWSWTGSAVKGELVLRAALNAGLPYDRARQASTGWGADRLLTFEAAEGDGVGFAWVVRWDDAGEAREYEAALRDYLDSRGTRDGEVWRADGYAYRVETVGPETVVLLAGAPAFVDDASVSGTVEDVTVEP